MSGVVGCIERAHHFLRIVMTILAFYHKSKFLTLKWKSLTNVSLLHHHFKTIRQYKRKKLFTMFDTLLLRDWSYKILWDKISVSEFYQSMQIEHEQLNLNQSAHVSIFGLIQYRVSPVSQTLFLGRKKRSKWRHWHFMLSSQYHNSTKPFEWTRNYK